MKPVFNRLYVCSLLCSVICLLISCNNGSGKQKSTTDSTAASIIPGPTPVSPQETERIKTACALWYDSVLKQKGFNGGILVAKNGNIIFERYNGTGHLPGTDSITPNTALHIASTSKTFTAMAILKLAQEGKLKIDDEFSKYFPQFDYPGVTIRNMLNHRSGLSNYVHSMEALGWDKHRFVTNEDVMEFLITRKSELRDAAPPDTHFSYSNSNYALLALLIEKVTGRKYAAYLDDSFFKPLQMKNTFVFSLADSAKANPSYDWRGKLLPLDFLDPVYGDKNIYTTVRDLLTWDRALTGNVLFSSETLQQAYAPYSNEKPGIKNYGLGWRMYIYPNGKKIIYHNGRWHGTNATFIRLPDDTATIIAIGNKFTRSVYHARILASIFGNYFGPVDEDETDLLKPKEERMQDSLLKKEPTKKYKGRPGI